MKNLNNEFNLDKEIEQAIKEGPTFNQSNFQTYTFNIAKHKADARSYRQVLLELNNKYIALKQSRINRKKINAQISMLKRDIEIEKDEYKKIILECDIEERLLGLDVEEKLILDAINECNALYAIFKTLPKCSFDEFEKQEQDYWTKRLTLDAELDILSTGRIGQGTASSLLQIGLNPLQLQLDIATNQQDTVKQLIELK